MSSARLAAEELAPHRVGVILTRGGARLACFTHLAAGVAAVGTRTARAELTVLRGVALGAPAAALLELHVVALARVARHAITKILADVAPRAGVSAAVGPAAPRLAPLIEGVPLAQRAAAACLGAAIRLTAAPWHAPLAAQVAALALAVRAVIALHLAPRLA